MPDAPVEARQILGSYAVAAAILGKSYGWNTIRSAVRRPFFPPLLKGSRSMTSATTKGNKAACSTSTQGDAASRERIAKYIKDMPAKIETMTTQCNCQDYAALQIAARQLRESAGAYGFEQIVPYAEKLEKIAKAGQPTEQVRKALDELVGICNRIQTGKC
jgi:HPt (histidine-containing phosphotransfer) domain-containing protein